MLMSLFALREIARHGPGVPSVFIELKPTESAFEWIRALPAKAVSLIHTCNSVSWSLLSDLCEFASFDPYAVEVRSYGMDEPRERVLASLLKRRSLQALELYDVTLPTTSSFFRMLPRRDDEAVYTMWDVELRGADAAQLACIRSSLCSFKGGLSLTLTLPPGDVPDAAGAAAIVRGLGFWAAAAGDPSIRAVFDPSEIEAKEVPGLVAQAGGQVEGGAFGGESRGTLRTA
ncbi:hypothetical protein DFJ74DRAFT_647874 [Hyaloraphidium curvatum]|nr:hypothetical protein DFJ74DRAFT_647874 [Hyaloraphidium curvatum]